VGRWRPRVPDDPGQAVRGPGGPGGRQVEAEAAGVAEPALEEELSFDELSALDDVDESDDPDEELSLDDDVFEPFEPRLSVL
jgi:hypothetical protein